MDMPIVQYIKTAIGEDDLLPVQSICLPLEEVLRHASTKETKPPAKATTVCKIQPTHPAARPLA